MRPHNENEASQIKHLLKILDQSIQGTTNGYGRIERYYSIFLEIFSFIQVIVAAKSFRVSKFELFCPYLYFH